MKNLLKIFVLFVFGLLLFSCEKDDDIATIDKPTNSSLNADKTSLVLLKANAAQNAITFNLNLASYGVNLAQNNQLQFAVKGTNFAAPKNVDIQAGQSSITYTVEQFNTVALGLGLAVNSASQVEVRLKSAVASLDTNATNLPVTYSPVITITVTPYALISYMYAPGAYQGWDPTTANTLVSSTSNGIFIGYINFPAAGSEFKVTQDKNWNVAYGGSGGNLSSSGGNLQSPGAGYYRITVNMNTMTYTLVPYQLSIIGSATPGGWGADTDMTWDNAQLKWKVVSTFTTGEMKFRLNHDWGTNWGDDGANGTLDAGGANISVTAGVHTVLFNPFDLTYTVQ
ncbi:SusE domain-containing protein [uncultured Chryseobacterium sp.]|uniref:SusE domain-containing protein n=1 Tax=uncultured Chryseobacterium sp. TaxID=259322 RepID=UPI0025CEA89B|nr:SusE domain-containing protein [uncultured Chryseobacterium sp.]